MNRNIRKKTKQSEISDKECCDLGRQVSGVKAVRMVSPAEVVTAPWVRLKCQFGCGGYGQCLVCPPFTPTPDQMRMVLDSYRRAILIHFDAKTSVKAAIADLERTIFLRGAWKAFGLGGGPCHFCRTCELQTKECRHPDQARPSMEACGIDVFSTVRKAGLPIEVIRTRRQCPNYYGLILVE